VTVDNEDVATIAGEQVTATNRGHLRRGYGREARGTGSLSVAGPFGLQLTACG
jgi:hypothetical protein